MARKVIKKEIITASEGDIMRLAIKDRGITQLDVADRLGLLQSTVSSSMNRKRTTVDSFRRVLNVMDYDIAVIDRESGEVKWILAQEK